MGSTPTVSSNDLCRIGLTNRASVYGTDEAGLTPACDTTLKNPIALWVYGWGKFLNVKARLLVLMCLSSNRSGYQNLTLKMWVRFPLGTPFYEDSFNVKLGTPNPLLLVQVQLLVPFLMLTVAQLVERWIVAPHVAGSNSASQPTG